MKLTEQTIKQRIKKQYPNGLDLVYIDYRENFDELPEKLEELANTGYLDSAEVYEPWGIEAENQSMDNIMQEIFNEQEREQINDNEDLLEAFKNTCYRLDTSNPIKDLLNNTSRQYFYYDLNYPLGEIDWSNSEADIQGRIKQIAKILRISPKKYQVELNELVANAGYGGNLVILFLANPKDLYNTKSKYIKFNNNFEICLMNRANGSGWSVGIDIPLLFNFIRENLHNDRGAEVYSFSDDVCGMTKWDNNTDFEYTNKIKSTDKLIKIQPNQEAKEFSEQEKQYQKTFDNGGCTFGDMKYSRHRDVEYINNYPCGNKCKICGTFWID